MGIVRTFKRNALKKQTIVIKKPAKGHDGAPGARLLPNADLAPKTADAAAASDGTVIALFDRQVTSASLLSLY